MEMISSSQVDAVIELLGARCGLHALYLFGSHDASPILVRQVLQHGRLLADAEPRQRAEFIARALTEYADLKRVRAGAERALVDRIHRAGG